MRIKGLKRSSFQVLKTLESWKLNLDGQTTLLTPVLVSLFFTQAGEWQSASHFRTTYPEYVLVSPSRADHDCSRLLHSPVTEAPNYI